MRATQFYTPTLRQAPAEAEIASHRLLLRGGFIRPLAAGIFSFEPLGLRVLRKIENIIRSEMNAAGALEVLLPVLNPRELWERSGRWATFQPEPFKLQDKSGREFCLGPTHEEAITDLVARDVNSYRQLPLTLYQIQVKFRDEMRPRGGLIRVKEFLMKDAYSFDVDEAGLDRSYEAMYHAYVRIFERLKLPVMIVEAEAGSIGGHETREFMLLCEAGEDTVFSCDNCDYASNAECATSRPPQPRADTPAPGAPQLVPTPGAATIEAVSQFLNVAPSQLVKTLLYKADAQFVAALVRGDRELNETKLQRALRVSELRMATAEEVQQLSGAAVGFAGPVGLPDSVKVIADHEIHAMGDFVVGANQDDAHLVGVEVGRDFQVDTWADLRMVADGDPCPRCATGRLRAHRAIELGHVFKLGTSYAQSLGALYLDEDGNRHPMVMGCYGIGVSRCMAAVVEQYHDENGIIWPMSVAPFQVVILLLDPNDSALAELADTLAGQLQAQGLEVLIDDRDERPGPKFKDADLIGYPLHVVLGKKAATEGLVEVRRRCDAAEKVVPTDQVVSTVLELAEDAV